MRRFGEFLLYFELKVKSSLGIPSYLDLDLAFFNNYKALLSRNNNNNSLSSLFIGVVFTGSNYRNTFDYDELVVMLFISSRKKFYGN